MVWSVTLRDGHRLRVFESRILMKILGLKRDVATGESGEDYIMRNFMICIAHQILLGSSNQEE